MNKGVWNRQLRDKKNQEKPSYNCLCFVKFKGIKVSDRLWLAKYQMHLITWCQRAQNFEISKNLGKFGSKWGIDLLEVQLCFGNEIYKSLTMTYHLGWGIFEVHISHCEVHDSYIILLLLLLSFDLMIVQYLIIAQWFGSEFYSSSSFTLPPSLDYITLVNIE